MLPVTFVDVETAIMIIKIETPIRRMRRGILRMHLGLMEAIMISMVKEAEIIDMILGLMIDLIILIYLGL